MASETTAYNLHAAIAALAEDMPNTTPRDIAIRLVEEMPESEKDGLLASALTRMVRTVIAREGSRLMVQGQSRFETTSDVKWEVALLRERVLVNGRTTEIGSLTRKDCVDLAKEREIQAEHLARRATQFKALAAILNVRDLATVSEIPAEDLRKVFGHA